MKMKNGYRIVIEGKNFDPSKYIEERLEPDHVCLEGESKSIEFGDECDVKYPLDMIAEAIDLLDIHKDYFRNVVKDKNVETKVINFSIDTEYEFLNIDSKQIKLLNELGFELSFDLYGK